MMNDRKSRKKESESASVFIEQPLPDSNDPIGIEARAIIDEILSDDAFEEVDENPQVVDVPHEDESASTSKPAA